jgi:hypothetical protein
MSFQRKLGVAGTTPSVGIDAYRSVSFSCVNQNGISSAGGADGAAAAAAAGGVED